MSDKIGELINKSAEFLKIPDAMEKLRDICINGLDTGKTTGWPYFDQYFRFPPMGQLSVVTGSPGSGKSEWLDSLAINAAVKHGWKIFCYSPENYPAEYHLQKLAEKYLGKPLFADYANQTRATDEEIAHFEKFITRHFTFIDCHINNADVDMVLNSIFLECIAKKVDMAIIDPWNKLESQRGSRESETDFIGRCLTRIQMFSRQKGISFWIVAHPSKPMKQSDGGFKKVSLYDISGSSHWYNMVDNGFIIHRSWSERIDQKFITHCRIAKIKDRRYGKFGEMDFRFEPASGRYFDIDPGSERQDSDSGKRTF